MSPTIQDIETIVRDLNHKAYAGEVEHHGMATTRFELRANGDHICVMFLGHMLWWSEEDDREEDPTTEDGREWLYTYLVRESTEFMTRMTATATPDTL